MSDWEDRPLPEDDAIKAAFPTRSGNHEAYGEAMRLVGARRSKFGLIALVNWLLVERESWKKAASASEDDRLACVKTNHALFCRVKSLEAAVIKRGGTVCDHGAACDACILFDAHASQST